MHSSRTKGRAATKGTIAGRFALSVGKPTLPAPVGWHWTALEAVARLESGHTPSRRHDEYWNGGVPWIGIRDAIDHHGRTIFDTHQKISNAGLANSSARLLPKGTVCLSRTASVGFVVVMGESMATSQDFVNWVCGPDLEPDYLKYVLIAERESLFQFASGTTHQTIYYPEAKAFHALLPPIAEQRAILAILRPLDEKIDVNRRTSETLDAMARTLFRSWFVDFNPVHAKEEGRKPEGIDAATAALFSEKFEESELGPIPSAWAVARLGDVFELKRGYDLPRGQRSAGNVPVVSSSGISGTHDRPMAAAPGIVTGRYGTIGKVFFVREPFWPLNTTLYVHDLKGTDPLWAFHLLNLIDFEKFSDKAAVPGINRNHLHEERVIKAPREIQAAFGRLANTFGEKSNHAANEAKTLGDLRDALLPKLLSGEVRVPDAERIVKEAV